MPEKMKLRGKSHAPDQSKYEVLPAILDFHVAKDNEILVHPEDNWRSLCPVGADNKRNLCATARSEEGDVDGVMAECDTIVEHTYHTVADQQAMMETFRTYCSIDAYGRLNIFSSTQIVFHVRRIVSNALVFRNPRSVCQNPESAVVSERNRPLFLRFIRHL